MRNAQESLLQLGARVTVPLGLYAGLEGTVVEIQPITSCICRARLDLPGVIDPWIVYWNEPMSETEWLLSTDTASLERFLEAQSPRPSARKRRLYGCACCRCVWKLLPPPWQDAVQISEEVADGWSSRAWLSATRSHLPELDPLLEKQASRSLFHAVASILADSVNLDAARWDIHCFHRDVSLQDQMRALLRDIFGNPFRRVRIAPGWRTWQAGLIPQLAQTIYDERNFAEMLVLADALEDAGCQDEQILQHCREHPRHARGCWVLDALLEKC